MKVKHCVALILTVSLAAMALTYWYVTTRGSAMKPLASIESQPVVPPLITTARPTMRQFTLRVPWIGTVESQASVKLTALVAGRIEVVEPEDQTRIEKGRLVVRLGGPQTEGKRAKLVTEVESLKSRLDLARQKVKWLKENLKARLATRKEVAAAQDSKVGLETQLREARLNLETFEKQTHISAPMSGIFTNRLVSVGQDVNAGQVVGEIVDADHLRIVAASFPPQDIELQSKEANIRLDEDQTLNGRVRRVLPHASGTGAVLVWIEGPQIDKHLRPGQTVGGSMVVEVRPETLAIPVSAIVYDSEEHPHIFVQQGGTYRPHSVKLGLVQDGWVEVLSGLEQKDSVVTQGAYELFHHHFNEQFKMQD